MSSMNLKFMYLQAMRDQNPKMFRRLKANGTLDRRAKEAAIEGERMYRSLLETRADPPTMADKRECEEIVRAEILQFPDDDEMTPEQEEMIGLRGDRPMVSPD